MLTITVAIVLAVAELAMPRGRPTVCRCLFGRPSPGDVDRFLQETEEALEHLADEASQRWDFDFRAGRPLDDIPGRSRRYEWTAVNSRDSVPPVYNKLYENTKKGKSARANEMSADTSEPAADVATSLTSNTAVSEAASEFISSATESPAAAHSEYNPSTNYASPESSSNGCDSK